MKNPSRASINLGNETHARGFNDGLNARPKTIKKSHAHAHRYHIGYRLGEAERLTTMKAALAVEMHQGMNVVTMHYHHNSPFAPGEKPKGFLSRFIAWIRS